MALLKVQLEGVARLRLRLQKKARELPPKPLAVVIGYRMPYAVYVHENLQAYHPHGQAKFLEQPLRELSNNGTLALIIRLTVKAGGQLAAGLLAAGRHLLEASKPLVPVDTGALRDSGFVRMDK